MSTWRRRRGGRIIIGRAQLRPTKKGVPGGCDKAIVLESSDYLNDTKKKRKRRLLYYYDTIGSPFLRYPFILRNKLFLYLSVYTKKVHITQYYTRRKIRIKPKLYRIVLYRSSPSPLRFRGAVRCGVLRGFSRTFFS